MSFIHSYFIAMFTLFETLFQTYSVTMFMDACERTRYLDSWSCESVAIVVALTWEAIQGRGMRC